MKPEMILGVPFYTPSRDWRDFMKIGALVEDLIQLKKNYSISYPDDIINLACNILEKIPNQQMTVTEWLEQKASRQCVVYHGNEERKAVFHGFCDNNDKCVVEYEDGELHKAFVWRVKFMNKE